MSKEGGYNLAMERGIKLTYTSTELVWPWALLIELYSFFSVPRPKWKRSRPCRPYQRRPRGYKPDSYNRLGLGNYTMNVLGVLDKEYMSNIREKSPIVRW